MLALAFLVLIGVALVADGFKFHIPRGYIYFAIVFAAAVELFNVLARRNRQEGRQIAGFGRRVDKAAAMAFVRIRVRRLSKYQGRDCHDQGRARAQGGGSGSPGV